MDPLRVKIAEEGKQTLSRSRRMLRFITSTFDPRAYLHMVRLVNFYNYSHVQPRRRLILRGDVTISPNACFTHPERIIIGNGTRISSRNHLWAGPNTGRIVIGECVAFGPDVFVTAAEYCFNDGSPVFDQAMREADVVIGDDVWLGAGAMVLAGVTIGSGAIIGAGAVIRADLPPGAIAIGNPARVIGRRDAVYPGAQSVQRTRQDLTAAVSSF